MTDNLTQKLREHHARGGFLLLPNHTEHDFVERVQAFVAQLPITFVTLADLPSLYHPEQSEHARVVPTSTEEETREAVRREVEAGRVVIPVYPAFTRRPATTLAASGAIYRRFLAADTPVAPLHLDLTYESRLSAHKEQTKHVSSVGPLFPSGTGASVLSHCQGYWLDEAADCFQTRPDLGVNLGREVLGGLKAHGKRHLYDALTKSTLAYDKLLAGALTLAPLIGARTAKRNVAIVLPPGSAGVIANVAAVFAGKVPVNLNFTAARASVESAIKQSEVDLIVTADKVVRSLQDFPWLPTRSLLLLDQVMPGLSAATKKQYLWSKVLPASWLASRLKLSATGGDEPATILFTSGSSGEPKGVPLSHRNLLSNIAQFSSRLLLDKSQDKILSSLPFFHSFGITVGLLFPLIEGFSMVTYPRPTDTVKLGGLIDEHKLSLLVSTPTFLRGFLKRVNAEQLLPLKLVVTGAEKLQDSLAEQFEERFGKKVLEGYGLTETSPVSNTNLPDLPASDGKLMLPTHRGGSVGQMMPGLALKLTSADTGGTLPLNEVGVVNFRGPNVFGGYLNRAELNREVFQDGWFRTGDLGRLDDDGFLYIDGRISRFSKIGGEMVPHEVVEERIVKVQGWEGEDVRRIAVMSVPDESKGEALVLLCTESMARGADVFLLNLRTSLLEAGVPALWIPKKVVAVEEIPALASGKLDLAACQKLAERFA